MLRPGRLALLLILANLLVFGYRWWSTLPRYPIRSPARDLVLTPADLPPAFRPDPGASRPIDDNPYADYTEHYRSGYTATFFATAGSEWGETRIASTSFVLSRQGAERVYRLYRDQLRHRGREQTLPRLGGESHFILARDEPGAPVVVVGVVRVENALITLTVLSDRALDPAVVHGWAGVLAERARGA